MKNNQTIDQMILNFITNQISEEQLIHNSNSQQNLIPKTIDSQFCQPNINSDYSQKLQYPREHTYSFPIQMLQLTMITGKDHFKQLIREEAGDSLLDEGWKIYRYQLKNLQTNIYARCLYCPACIYYRETNDKIWKLLKYNNNHVHDIQHTKTYRLLTSKAIAQNLHLQNKELVELINQSYPMNRAEIMQKKRSLLKNPKFKIIKQFLEFLSYDYRLAYDANDLHQDGYPQTLVAVSKQQKVNYQRFGQCICYSITYNSVKQKSVDGKNLCLGIFTGFDNNKRIIIFGFSLFTFSETTDQFKKIFRWFFQLIQCNITTAVITDHILYLTYALQQLKQQSQSWKFHHIFDSLNFIRTFVTPLNANIIKIIANHLRKLIREYDPTIGLYYLNQLEKLMIKQSLHKQYHYLSSNIQHICLWKMPKLFIGLNLHSHQGIYDLLNIKIQNEMSLYRLIEKIDKSTKQRDPREMKKEYQNYRFQLLFDDTNLRPLRDKLQKNVFNAFLINYRKAQFYVLVKQNQSKNQYHIQHFIDGDQYFLTKRQCICGALEKTGIPCQHIIFIKKFMYPNQSFLNLINKRWIVPKQKDKQRAILNGRPKRSRRNRM